MFKFLYNFLFIDQKSQTLSHTKFWSNVGYAIMSWSFTYVVWTGETKIDYMLWALFGVVVIGNRSLRHVLEKKND